MISKNLLNQILELNLGELNDLILKIEQIFEISQEEISTKQKSLTNDNESTKQVELNEKSFVIKLLSFTEDKKFSVMKTIKSIFSLSLKETTEILNKLPYILKTTNSEIEANKIKKEVEEMGGKVSIE